MGKGKRENLDRLLQAAYNQQRREETIALVHPTHAKPEISPRPKSKLRLDVSLGLLSIVLGIIYGMFPPHTKLAAILWIVVLVGCAYYPALHSFDWLLSFCWVGSLSLRLKCSLTLSAVFVLLFSTAALHRQWDIFRPSISIKALLSPSYNEGHEVAGIKWEKGFQDIRLAIHDLSEYPIHNLNLTVEIIPKSGDTFRGMGQISEIDGVKFYPPEWPDMSLTLRGLDGQNYDLNMRDAGHLGFGFQWRVVCPILTTESDLRLILVAESAKFGSPTRLRIFGSLERVSNDGYQVAKFDQIVEVVR